MAQSSVPISPFNLDNKKTDVQVELGGTSTIDLITLKGTNPGVPLRFGAIFPGSERVQLGSQILVRGQDYTVDNAAGVIYLMRAVKPGDMLSVAYRYGAKVDPTLDGQRFNGIAGFKFDVAPGAMKMMIGMGMTERAADGRVISSNIYGLNNSFNLGQKSKLSGLFLVGDRQKTSNQAGLAMKGDTGGTASSQEEGKSKLILQQFNTALLGGSITADFQEASSNFAGFNSLRESGVSEAKINELTRERGLTRQGLSMNGLKLGSGLGFSSAFKNIGDGDAGINWRSYGLKSGDPSKKGFSLDYSSQNVDSNFNRFRDITEADREQLMRERGMMRQNISGAMAQSLGKVSFSMNTIQDSATGQDISRREVALDTSKLKFNVGDQDVSSGFTRIGSLQGQEQGMYGREVGLHRQWMALDSSILGKSTPFNFKQSILASNSGAFTSRDAGVKTSSFSLQHTSRGSDSGFGSLGSMTEPEIGANIQSIAAMYGPNVGIRPEDRGFFLQGAGISRTYTRVDVKPFQGWNLGFEHLNLQGSKDGAKVDTLNLGNKNTSFSLRSQNTGKDFREVTRLMQFERQSLSPISGLDRLDASLNMNLGKAKTLNLATTSATVAGDGVKRTTAAYRDNRIEATIGVRQVDSGMTNVNQLADPERDFLNSLRGFSQRDAHIKWQLMPNLKVDASYFDAANGDSQEERAIRNMILDWAPAKGTTVNYTHLENRSKDPVSSLFAQVVEKITVNKDLGKYGSLNLQRETQNFEGRNTGLPDMDRTFLSYETRVDKLTRVRTEQTLTNFDNGEKENINANTVSRELSKQAGVSVTDTRVDRQGTDRDEVRRNYGFWMNLGSGVKVSYGYARHLNGETAGTLTSSFGIGKDTTNFNPDQAAGVQKATVGGYTLGGGYGVNQWQAGDSTRTQAFSNVSFSTAKPLQLGALKNLQFDMGMDTAADYAAWMRESKTFGIGGQVGNNKFNYRYVGMMHPSGYRGIDRSFNLETDPSDKRWLKASLFYKLRTLPWDEQVMIRNFNITARPIKSVEVSHQLVTNPEVARGDVFLGSVPQAARSNKWQLNFNGTKDTAFGASWEELVNDQNKAMTRTGGVNLSLFQKSGSPLKLFYGLEQLQGNVARRTMHRYHMQFDQKAGPNQMLSIFAGNVSWEHQISDGQLRNNWTVRVDYQVRF
ncbi:MAG: hypothetical protein ACOYON_07445 [Fimbriimonas sp.]